MQIYEQGCKFAMGSMIKNCIAYEGKSMGSQFGKLQNGCNILVATPGCLLGFVEQGRMIFGNVEYFVLDQAEGIGFGLEIVKCINNPMMPGKDATVLAQSDAAQRNI